MKKKEYDTYYRLFPPTDKISSISIIATPISKTSMTSLEKKEL